MINKEFDFFVDQVVVHVSVVLFLGRMGNWWRIIFLNYCGKAKTKIIPSSLPEKGGFIIHPQLDYIIGASKNMVYI